MGVLSSSYQKLGQLLSRAISDNEKEQREKWIEMQEFGAQPSHNTMCTAVLMTAQPSHSSYIYVICKNYFYPTYICMHTYISMLNLKILKALLAHKYAFNQTKDGGG